MLGFNRRLLALALLLAALQHGAVPSQLPAHEGPPFPLFVDKPLGELWVSLWADPDIGDARFFAVLETAVGTAPSEEPRVAIWTEPTSGRLPRKTYPAARQSLRNHMQFEAKPYFDQRDRWKIGITVTGTDGKQRELLTEVESTPPGLGPWDLAIYLFPFALLGAVWAIAMMRRRRASMQRQPSYHAAAKSSAGAERGQSSQTATGGAP